MLFLKMKRNNACEPINLVGIEKARAKLEKKKSGTLALIVSTATIFTLVLMLIVKL